MMICSHCGKDRETVREPDQNYNCCSFCGKVLVDNAHTNLRIKKRQKENQGLRYGAVSFKRFLDIDDIEAVRYIYNNEEMLLRKIIWEAMNKEYLEEQATNKAATKEVRQPRPSLEKSRKEKKLMRDADNKNSSLAKSCEETCPELKRKSFSSKINYKVLDSLFKDNTKKQRIESRTEGHTCELKSTEDTALNECENALVDDGHNDDNDDDDDDDVQNEDDGHIEDIDDDYYYNNQDGDYYENAEYDYDEQPYDEWDA